MLPLLDEDIDDSPPELPSPSCNSNNGHIESRILSKRVVMGVGNEQHW